MFSCILFYYKYSNSQSFNPAPQTWFVDAMTTTCENSSNECLLIKQAGKKEFEIFNENIEGFNYEKGYTYTIIVKQEIKQPPIAIGESVFKYVLVKIVSKKSININSNPINSIGSANSSQQKIFEVNFETVPCESDNSKNCLLVKEKGKKEFEILNATIFGFNYQPGYSYLIAVKETNNGNYYLADEISKKLIKNISGTFTPLESIPESSSKRTSSGNIIQQTSIQTSSLLDRKWYLRKIKDNDGSSFVTDDNVIFIDINTFKDRIDGFGACNTFATVLKSDLNTTFEVSKLTSNYAMCGNKKIEDLFYTLLQKVNRYEIRNNFLMLSDQWKFLLSFTSDPNNKEDIYSTYTPPTIVKSGDNVYATDQPIVKNENKSAPVANETESIETITVSTATTITSKNNDVDELYQKQIEELQKKQAEAKKQKEQDSIIKSEQDRLQRQKDTELKQLAEKEKFKQDEIKKAEQDKLAKQKETINIKTFSPVNVPSNNSVNTSDNTIDITELPKEKTVCYLNGSKLEIIEKGRMMANSDGEKLSLSVFNNESTTHFSSSSIPRFIIKMPDNSIYGEYISLFKANVKGDERIVNVRPAKNRIEINVIKVKQGVYEINIPKDISSGEYVFLFPKTMDIACFGISK